MIPTVPVDVPVGAAPDQPPPGSSLYSTVPRRSAGRFHAPVAGCVNAPGPSPPAVDHPQRLRTLPLAPLSTATTRHSTPIRLTRARQRFRPRHFSPTVAALAVSSLLRPLRRDARRKILCTNPLHRAKIIGVPAGPARGAAHLGDDRHGCRRRSLGKAGPIPRFSRNSYSDSPFGHRSLGLGLRG